MQRGGQAVKIAHQIVLHHLNVRFINGSIGIDVGFGKVDVCLCIFIALYVPFHQVDVQQLYFSVSVSVAVQDVTLSKHR